MINKPSSLVDSYSYTYTQPVYISEEISARIKDRQKDFCLQISEYSPFSMTLVSTIGLISEINDQPSIKLELNFLGQLITCEGQITQQYTVTWRNKELPCYEFVFLDSTVENDERICWKSIGAISCVVKDPRYYKRNAFFELSEIGPDSLVLKTEVKNNFILPNAVFNLDLFFPTLGKTREPVKVKRIVYSNDEKYFLVTVNFMSAKKKTLKYLSEFTLIFKQGISRKRLKLMGMPLSFNSESIITRSCNGPSEYQEILELRRLAYGTAGNFGLRTSDSLDKFTDDYDKFSRHVLAEVGGNIVGCGRLLFTNGDISRSYLAKIYPELPSFIRNSQNFVEPSYLCVHPEFRDGPMLIRISMELLRICIIEKVEYSVAIVAEFLQPTYQRMGYKIISRPFDVKGVEVKLMYCDIQKTISGENPDFLTWALAVAPLVEQAHKYRSLKASPFLRIKAIFARLCLPIIEWVLEYKIERRKKKN